MFYKRDQEFVRGGGGGGLWENKLKTSSLNYFLNQDTFKSFENLLSFMFGTRPPPPLENRNT